MTKYLYKQICERVFTKTITILGDIVIDYEMHLILHTSRLNALFFLKNLNDFFYHYLI